MWLDVIAELVRSQEGRRTIIAVLFYAGLTFAVFWGYLLGGNAIVGSDGMGPPADLAMMKEESSYFSAWRAFPALGHLNFPSPTLGAFYWVSMEILSLSPVATTQFMLVSSFFVAGFSMYICTYRILGNYWAGLMAGLAYLFNQVFLSQVTEAHHYFLIGYALFPLLFLVLYRSLVDLDRRSALTLPPLALVFGTVAAPNQILMTSVFLAIFLVVFILIARGWSLLRRTYAAMVGLIGTGLVLLPTVLMKYLEGGTPVLSTYYPIEQARLYSSYTLYHSFVLASSENTFIHSSATGQWTFISDLWLLGLIIAGAIPIIALFSLFVRKRHHLVISLLVPSAIFILLATGTNPPFGDLFTFLFKNVPLMDSVRVYSRLHLLTGFAMAMLLAVVIAEIRSENEWLLRLKGWTGVVFRYLFHNRGKLSIILAFCLIFPSSTVLIGEIRSFEIPPSYMAPYEWVADQEGDFRVLNLPFQNVFYKNDLPHFDGYPTTMTMDVGMYSPTFTNLPYAFGLETKSYWTFIGETISDRQFGHRELSDLLGGTASVRYVVSQNYASSGERELFASMDNVTLSQAFPGGGAVYLNGQYQERVHGLGALCLASGNRAVLPLIMGSGLVDMTTDGVVLMGDVEDGAALDSLLERSQMIVVPNGDMLQMVSEVFPWTEEQRIDLKPFGDKHSEDAMSSWILTNDDIYAGRTSLPTIRTSGEHTFTVPITAPHAGEYDLLIRMMYGPTTGGLDITIDDETLISIVPWAAYHKAQWLRVTGIELSEGRHELRVGNDGTGMMSIEQAVLAPSEVVESKLDELNHLLERYGEKVVLLYSASQASQWRDGTYLPWEGEEGKGIANTLSVPVTGMVGNDHWVHDLEANGSMAVWIRSDGLSLYPQVADLASGVTYPMELSLRYQGEPMDDAVATITVQGRDERTGALVLLGITVLKDNNTTSGYSDYGFNITVPEGVDQVEMLVAPVEGVTDLYVDLLTAKAPLSDFPQSYFELPMDGSYIVQVKGVNTSADPYIVMDDVLYPLSGTNGTLTSAAINITAGTHEIEVGVSNLYSIEFVPTSLRFEQADVTVSFQRKSNIEYTALVSTDQAGWVLLSESYNGLWVAEMNGTQLDHVRVNSMVNAYYLPVAGNHTITIRFQGQGIYDAMVLGLLGATLASIGALVLIMRPRVRTALVRPGRERRTTWSSFWRRVLRKGGN